MKQLVAPVMESHTRQRIVSLLYSAPQGPSEIATALGLSQPYISNQLAALKSHRLVTSRRVGRKSVYQLEDKAKAAMMTALSSFSSR
ncbi:ArsR/SmtB family transcription factor [Pseudarthrobacter quantipunctorum]|uniref:Metalloregulator ArsR/SmtB family transcription factor n=1 Tax=Pseudarthrobacter quantipunctorum TaxID=3128980 RepID=A0ABZ2R533_9MICC